MRIVFFGNTLFSLHILKSLVEEGLDVVGVVTNPDKAQRRSSKLIAPCVKTWAEEVDLQATIFQPSKLSVGDFKERVAELNADVFVVVAYGKILPQSVLDIPKLECINVHASLLPKYRGASPIEAAIASGDSKTGVSIMRMVKAMDAGPVFLKQEVPILPTMDKEQLSKKLQEAGSCALLKVLKELEKGVCVPVEQDETEATYVHKIGVEETKIVWSEPAEVICNKVRAYSPKPAAWMEAEIGSSIKRVKVLSAECVEGESITPVGANVIFSGKQWVVKAGVGAVRLLKVQVEGKKAMEIRSFLSGCQSAQVLI